MQAENDLTAEQTSQWVEVEGIQIHYHEAGTGTPLIMLHGSGPGATGWANYHGNISALAEHFRVICPDLPGFGQSDMKPLGSPMPGWYSDVIRSFMDTLGIEKAHFVGNSFGGAITLKLGMDTPERIGRMVLMGPAGSVAPFSVVPTRAVEELLYFYDGEGPSIERMKRFGEDFVYDPSLLTDELWQERLKTALRPEIVDNPPMRPNPDAPREELWRDPRLTKLPHEVLMLWGREDRVMPFDMSFMLLKQIPRARLLVIPQCGHWVQWEHAQEFNYTVRNFLVQN